MAVNEEYVSYTRWRCVQRLLSATVNVFGVQAMVMAVGLRDARAVAAGGAVVGAAAAVDWVLKDALGKVTRLGWAARMGREFDGDAKRWRFRSSLLYATGNGLQIATFAFPLLFLLLATVANCLKQVSMLTSTATRSAIYRSFAATETTNNLGDVTAKGEAQIAVVDLVGLLIGLVASKKLGVASTQANPRMLLAIYGSLSLLEIGAMYREIACVVFRQLNFERATLVVDEYVESGVCPSPRDIARRERILRRPRTTRTSVLRPLMTAASGMSRDELDRHVALASTDDFLVLDGAIVLEMAPPTALLDALHARARTLRIGTEGHQKRGRVARRADRSAGRGLVDAVVHVSRGASPGGLGRLFEVLILVSWLVLPLPATAARTLIRTSGAGPPPPGSRRSTSRHRHYRRRCRYRRRRHCCPSPHQKNVDRFPVGRRPPPSPGLRLGFRRCS